MGGGGGGGGVKKIGVCASGCLIVVILMFSIVNNQSFVIYMASVYFNLMYAWIFAICFQKNSSGIQSECQTVWIQIRPDIFFVRPDLGPNCLQSYQQTTLVGIELKIFQGLRICLIIYYL